MRKALWSRAVALVGAALMLVGSQLSAGDKLDLEKLYKDIPNVKAYIASEDMGVIKADRPYVIGLSLYSLNTVFYKVMADTMMAEIEASGCKPLLADCRSDVITQVSQIENFITQQVDAIILCPADPPSALNLALEKAYAAGIPVVAVDMPPDANAKYLTSCVTDAYQLGVILGEEIGKRLLAENPTGDIEYGIIGGIEGGVIPTARNNGAMDGLKSVDPENRIKRVSYLFAGDFTEESGLRVAENMLVANPNLKAIIGTCDAHVVGATAAAKRQGRDQGLIMATVDGSRPAMEIMKNGGPIKALALNSPKEVGTIATRITIALLNGEYNPPSKTMFMAPVLVTVENVEKYYDPNSEF